MKKLLLPVGLFALLGLGSCSEDFDVAAPYKSYTVVYGVLDPGDTAHYVRIQKAFLDENKSALEMSKTADSSYFPNLNVTIQPYNGSTPVGSAITLNRVDLAAEGYPKNAPANEQGFFTSPSYAYKFKTDLNPAYTYKLTINNPATGVTNTADAAIVSNNPDPNANGGFRVNSFFKDTVQLEFSNTLPTAKLQISGTTPTNGEYLEGFLRFNYAEVDASGNSVDKSVDYPISRLETDPVKPFNITILNSSLYEFLHDEIGPAVGVKRYMGFVEIHLFAGNQELFFYQQTNNAQGGLTGDQIRPFYTNISGENALGLFASKAQRSHYQGYITDKTLETLQTYELTKNLIIVGRTD